MEPRDIYITEFDLARLKELVNVGISFKERDRDYSHTGKTVEGSGKVVPAARFGLADRDRHTGA